MEVVFPTHWTLWLYRGGVFVSDYKILSEEARGIIRSTVTLVSLYSGMVIWMICAVVLEAFAEGLGVSNLILLSQALLPVSIASFYLAASCLRRRLGIPSTLTVSFTKPGTKEYERLVLLANVKGYAERGPSGQRYWPGKTLDQCTTLLVPVSSVSVSTPCSTAGANVRKARSD